MQSYEVKVNGKTFFMEADIDGIVSGHDILENAEMVNAFPYNAINYALEGELDRYGKDDEIDLNIENEFITISILGTPYA